MGISISCPFESILVNSHINNSSEPIKPTRSGNSILDGSDLSLISSINNNNARFTVDIAEFGNPKYNTAFSNCRMCIKVSEPEESLQIAQSLWNRAADFAELKHSSISFFHIEHHETAISRWSRAKTRAAKGLSKNGKAQKLALQHWLEAIDPRHRYGHNLHFYYVKWLESKSREPFFYWLDIGEGREMNLVEKCPRCKLQQQCIKYLGPMERKAYEVELEDGKLYFKESGEVVDTSSDPNAKWIFVLSASKALYVGKKKKGAFQHSCFLAGGTTSAAGRLVVENAILKAVWPHSGHYRPTLENFQEFISFLIENNVDLTDVKMDPVDEEDDKSVGKQRSNVHLRNNSSDEDMKPEKEDTFSSCSNSSRKLTYLQIPKRGELLVITPNENVAGFDDPYMDEEEKEVVAVESILQRINSHKETKSYQLGKQLSFKWTTGAGPRIGCVRDYPSELQFRALDKVNLSPRSASSPCVSKSVHYFDACGDGASPEATLSILSRRWCNGTQGGRTGLCIIGSY